MVVVYGQVGFLAGCGARDVVGVEFPVAAIGALHGTVGIHRGQMDALAELVIAELGGINGADHHPCFNRSGGGGWGCLPCHRGALWGWVLLHLWTRVHGCGWLLADGATLLDASTLTL